jgi:cytoskeletal protein RodZ
MKRIGIIGAAALFLVVGYTARAYAWQEPKEESKPAKEEQKAKPAAKPQEAKPAKQEPQAKPAQHEEKATAAKRQEPAKQEEKPAANPARQQEPAKQTAAKPEERGKAAAGQHAQRTPAEEQRQRAVPAVRVSVRTNVRIPDDRFRANFGREHNFRIGSPIIVGGFSRFQYGGFSFGFLQPWPEGWYYTDDVYVDYIDGEYFLFNPYYPDVRVGISVVI